jgi:hypothetical protein
MHESTGADGGEHGVRDRVVGVAPQRDEAEDAGEVAPHERMRPVTGRRPDQYGGAGHDDEEQDPRHGGCVAEVQLDEPLLIELDAVEPKRGRAARRGFLFRRSDVGVREVLGPVDNPDHEGEEDDEGDHRQRHAPEPLPWKRRRVPRTRGTP